MENGDNDPRFPWTLEEGERGREVWYSLVSHPERPVGFWYRYTLLSTDSGHQEARVWAALTEGTGVGSGSGVVTHRFPLDSAKVTGDPFRLTIDDNELTQRSARGSVENAEWSLSYEPDDRTFVPLEGDSGMGGETGDHWSANQSVEMTGAVEFEDETYRFEDAPGHQGHTVGTSVPPSWSWTHANSFGDGADSDTVVEALEFAGMVSVCFRRGGEVYTLNTMDQILEGNRSVENEPGRWVFEGSDEEVDLRVEIGVDGPGAWKKAAYLTPDDTVRYVAHASLADVRVEYETENDAGTLETDSGRAEWAEKEPPLGAADEYRPEEFAKEG